MNLITHALAGWTVANCSKTLSKRDMFIITCAGVIPDIDGLGAPIEILTRDSSNPLLWWTEYHHGFHTLLFCAVACAAASFFGRRKTPDGLPCGNLLSSAHTWGHSRRARPRRIPVADPIPEAFLRGVAACLGRPVEAERLAQHRHNDHSSGDSFQAGVAQGLFSRRTLLRKSRQGLRRDDKEKVSGQKITIIS